MNEFPSFHEIFYHTAAEQAREKSGQMNEPVLATAGLLALKTSYFSIHGKSWLMAFSKG